MNSFLEASSEISSIFGGGGSRGGGGGGGFAAGGGAFGLSDSELAHQSAIGMYNQQHSIAAVSAPVPVRCASRLYIYNI